MGHVVDFNQALWMAPEIPGYGEVRDFNKRFALKMGVVFGDIFKPSMAAMQPGSAEGLAEMTKEMAKLKGVPVMQVMRMGATTNGEPLPAASEAPLPASNGPEMPSAGDVAKQSATSAIASKLGGFGGFGKKKKRSSAGTTGIEADYSRTKRAHGVDYPNHRVLVRTSRFLAVQSAVGIRAGRFRDGAIIFFELRPS